MTTFWAQGQFTDRGLPDWYDEEQDRLFSGGTLPDAKVLDLGQISAYGRRICCYRLSGSRGFVCNFEVDSTVEHEVFAESDADYLDLITSGRLERWLALKPR